MRLKINLLNPKSIQDAIDKVEERRKKLGSQCNEITKRLVKEGVSYAKSLVPEVADQISGETKEEDGKAKGIIRAHDEAVFVEFGTGVRGYVNPYPKVEVMQHTETGYTDYMSGEHIFKTKDGRIGWMAPIGENGTYRFTEGVYSKAFMYFTAKHLREIAPQIAREVING